MRTVEIIKALGHENILATNRSTFEITKDTHVTKRGDCIIAVAADKGIRDLSSNFKRALRRRGTRLKVVIQAGDAREMVEAMGYRRLSFTHPTDLVVRKSDYVCGRTLGIGADKAAKDFSREFVEKLQNPKQEVEITLIVEDID